MLDATEQRIIACCNALMDDTLELTSDLVRGYSVLGQEQGALDTMERHLERLGLPVTRVALDAPGFEEHPHRAPTEWPSTGRYNVISDLNPGAPGPHLVFNGHLDVVPAEPIDMWTRPPWEPWQKDGWLYGRGAGDMKAGIAAMVMAVEAVRQAGVEINFPLTLQTVIEEECTGNGALACLQRGYRADAAIIPEPEDDKLVRANTGVIWFRVRVEGVPVHVREAGAGANAIEAAYELIRVLRALEEEWNARKGDHRHFEDLDHPINFNVGKIVGGDWASSVPAWCEFDCRIAIYPGTRAEDAAREIETHLRRVSDGIPFLANNPPQVIFNGFFAEGYVLEEGSAAEETLTRAHMASYRKPLESFVTPGYLDGRVFVIYGETPCLVYGPYSEGIHGFDERVSLASVKRVTGTIALFIAEWCGLEAI